MTMIAALILKKRLQIPLLALGLCSFANSIGYAQSDANPPNPQLRQATIFLEQVLRPWALVLPNWNRNPFDGEWQAARESCQKAKSVEDAKVIADASNTLPPESERVGDISFYRGDKGLQVFDMKTKEIKSYPDLQIGRSQSGTPVYQVGGEAGSLTIVIGRSNTDDKPAIVMNMGTALYISCRQPDPQ